MLAAFDRLFAKTAQKLAVSYTEEDLAEAKERFADRMAKVMDALDGLPFDSSVPQDLLTLMENSIEEVSPLQIVAQVAAVTLMQHSQFVLQQVAQRAAQQRLLETALDNVDTTYGGN